MQKVDDFMTARGSQLETVLVLDADKTLAELDAGKFFWQKACSFATSDVQQSPLRALLISSGGNPYASFGQATLLYEEAANGDSFEVLCHAVVSEISLYPVIECFLYLAATQEHVGVTVVTCGLRRVWQLVFKSPGIGDKVAVIGGGRISDGYVVAGEVKRAVVSHLRRLRIRRRTTRSGDGGSSISGLHRGRYGRDEEQKDGSCPSEGDRRRWSLRKADPSTGSCHSKARYEAGRCGGTL